MNDKFIILFVDYGNLVLRRYHICSEKAYAVLIPEIAKLVVSNSKKSFS